MGFLMAQTAKSLPAMQETQVWSLGWEDLLEKEMVTHSSVLEEEPGGLQSMRSQRAGHDWSKWAHRHSVYVAIPIYLSPILTLW